MLKLYICIIISYTNIFIFDTFRTKYYMQQMIPGDHQVERG